MIECAYSLKNAQGVVVYTTSCPKEFAAYRKTYEKKLLLADGLVDWWRAAGVATTAPAEALSALALFLVEQPRDVALMLKGKALADAAPAVPSGEGAGEGAPAAAAPTGEDPDQAETHTAAPPATPTAPPVAPD